MAPTQREGGDVSRQGRDRIFRYLSKYNFDSTHTFLANDMVNTFPHFEKCRKDTKVEKQFQNIINDDVAIETFPASKTNKCT